ncbi:MAG TPA: hypothetical protein VFQ88_09450 [Nevskiaceae bacterium]|nr:hypothetical protein [Nevskiaceae bacterium]
MIPIPPHLYKWTIIGCGALILLALFKPTRGIVTALWKLALVLLKHAYNILTSILHKLVTTVWDAHVVLFRNFMPRRSVIPSVARKSVRRI